MIHYTTWLIKKSKISNKLHANTNYARDLLNDASWTATPTLDTERSISTILDTSRLNLRRAINSRSSSVPCNSTSNSRSNLQLAFPCARQWNDFLIQRWIWPLTSPSHSSGWNSRECLVRFKWLHADTRADARRSNVSYCKDIFMD
jgi:hypothetical protein